MWSSQEANKKRRPAVVPNLGMGCRSYCHHHESPRARATLNTISIWLVTIGSNSLLKPSRYWPCSPNPGDITTQVAWSYSAPEPYVRWQYIITAVQCINFSYNRTRIMCSFSIEWPFLNPVCSVNFEHGVASPLMRI